MRFASSRSKQNVRLRQSDFRSVESSDEKSPFRIRPAEFADAEAIVRVHFEAVRRTAAGFYPTEVVESWSRQPDERRFANVRTAIAEGSKRLIVADQGGAVVAFGAITVSSGEIGAVYVHPSAGRRGVGGLVLAELERLALAHGLAALHLNASVNAEAFYSRHGYLVTGRGTHSLPNGIEMSCVMMNKSLNQKISGEH